jgi:endonuclease/exonuclease/phosphatase family metal-dependent hydrolase
LQEVDVNAHRTHKLNVAQEIARKLRLNYVFGREFEELTQGTRASPAYHGQATLSKWRISDSKLIRFRRQSNFWKPTWFKPRLPAFQERLGGRIALAAAIDAPGAWIIAYNLHLESRGEDDLRLAQLNETVQDAAGFASKGFVVIAGDLNLDASKPGAAEVLARAGFREAVPTARVPTTPRRHLLEPGRHIDWAFCLGPAQAANGRVHASVTASDHYPISFELHLTR